MRKAVAHEIVENYEVSIARACGIMKVAKSYFYYESVKDDSEVEAAIREKAELGGTLL